MNSTQDQFTNREDVAEFFSVPLQECLGVSDAARRFDVTPATIYNWAKKGRLERVNTDEDGAVFFETDANESEEDLRAELAGAEVHIEELEARLERLEAQLAETPARTAEFSTLLSLDQHMEELTASREVIAEQSTLIDELTQELSQKEKEALRYRNLYLSSDLKAKGLQERVNQLQYNAAALRQHRNDLEAQAVERGQQSRWDRLVQEMESEHVRPEAAATAYLGEVRRRPGLVGRAAATVSRRLYSALGRWV